MRNIQTSFTQHVTQLGLLGRTGEKDSRQIVFDCEKVLKEYPNAVIACIFQRSDGTSPYGGRVQADGFLRKVTLTATETAVAGEMQIELRAIEGDVIRKSAIFKGYIAGSLEGEGDTPDSPLDDVLNRLSVVEQEAVCATSAANEAAENVEETMADAQKKLKQIENDIETYQTGYADSQQKAETAIQAAEDAAANVSATAEAVQSAESERVKAEEARVSAESLRAEAEKARTVKEEARANAEDGRSNAEAERAKAEGTRVKNENARANAEDVRSEAEISRENVEKARVEAEAERVAAEVGRVSAEENRAASESARAAAETLRANAENERAASFEEMLGQASAIASRIKKVEDDYLTSADKTELQSDIEEAKQEAILAIMGEAGVDEKYDTLKEIADWILSDTTASAELVTRVSNIEKDYLTSGDKTALQKSLTELKGLVGELPDGVSGTVAGYIQQVQEALNAEADARENADSTLQAAIASEAEARTAADTDLQANIDTEAATRASQDEAIEKKLNQITDDTTSAVVQFGMNNGYLYYEEVGT